MSRKGYKYNSKTRKSCSGGNKKTKKRGTVYKKQYNKLVKKSRRRNLSGGVLDNQLLSAIQDVAEKTTGNYLPEELAKKIAKLKFQQTVTPFIKNAQNQRFDEYNNYKNRIAQIRETNLQRLIDAGYDPENPFTTGIPVTRQLAEPRQPAWY